MADFTRAASLPGSAWSDHSGADAPDLVEIGLLLPSHHAAALIQLSKLRRESVGQILRSIIHRELTAFHTPTPVGYDSPPVAPCPGHPSR